MTSHSHHQPSQIRQTAVTDKAEGLKAEIIAAQEREKKALADYQNLLRRTQEERLSFAKLANQDLILSLLEPLQHLSMTAEQIKSPVLDAVVKSLWQNLTAQGLAEIPCLGQVFDPTTMEAVDVGITSQKESNQLVKTVLRPGYRLNGQVIQVAKVGL